MAGAAPPPGRDTLMQRAGSGVFDTVLQVRGSGESDGLWGVRSKPTVGTHADAGRKDATSRERVRDRAEAGDVLRPSADRQHHEAAVENAGADKGVSSRPKSARAPLRGGKENSAVALQPSSAAAGGAPSAARPRVRSARNRYGDAIDRGAPTAARAPAAIPSL